MRVVHDPDGDGRVLASNVDTADSFTSQTLGLMGRSSLPDDYALVFRFSSSSLPLFSRLDDESSYRFIHMLFVGVPLDVLWLDGDEVSRVETLSPWTGLGGATADTIVELPAGAADGVEPGDTVVLEDDAVGGGGEVADSNASAD